MTAARTAGRRGRAAPLVEYPADPVELAQALAERGLSDGLPVVPPTPERVRAMLEYTDRDPLEVIGVLPPNQGEATVQAIAVNAVMAGCTPRTFPVVLATVQAIAEEAFNIGGINATTHPTAVLVLVSGPIAREVGIESGTGCMGPAFPANATIGRAIRQVLLNIAGARPGRGDAATQGSPAKFGFCFAENEEGSPWPLFQTTRGFDPGISTVTAASAEPPHNIQDSHSTTAEGLMQTVAGSLMEAGSNNMSSGGEPFLVIGPEMAEVIAAAGWTREQIQQYVFEHARFPLRMYSPGKQEWAAERMSGHGAVSSEDLDESEAKPIMELDPEGGLPVVDRPEDLHVLVAGGPGKHSVWIPSFGGSTRPVTVPITDRSGAPLASVEDLRG